VQTGTISFTFGTPFNLKLFVETAGSAYTYRGADAVGDLENTATWGGIISVKDTDGAEVANYTALSASGANYAEPITVPAPELTVQKVDPNTLQITWSTEFTGYTLEAVDNLLLSDWTPVPNEVVTTGGNFAVTIPVAGQQRYFRLKK
jgi:hypothetical protein